MDDAGLDRLHIDRPGRHRDRLLGSQHVRQSQDEVDELVGSGCVALFWRRRPSAALALDAAGAGGSGDQSGDRSDSVDDAEQDSYDYYYGRDVGDHQEPQELVIDPREAIRALRNVPPSERAAVIERYSGTGRAERDILTELSNLQPIADIEGFESAHRMTLYSLEVLDRNGARIARLPRLGPLKPLAGFLVSMILRWIVKNYQNTLSRRILRLYERRQAVAIRGTREHSMLLRARIDMNLIEPGYRSNPLGLPTFLLGGAVLSSLTTSLRAIFDSVFKTAVGISAFAIVVVVILGTLGWSAMFAAGVARRRIRLTTEQPVRTLWKAVGSCGMPPRDQSYLFATLAVVLSLVAWIAIPVALFVLVS